MQNKLNRSTLSALVVATLLAAPAWAEPMPDEAALQLLQRLNELEQELRNIRGDNEKLQHELDTVRKNQKDNFQQVDDRLEKLQDVNPPDKRVDTEKSTDTAVNNQQDTPEKADPNGFYSYGTGKSDDKNPTTPANPPADKPDVKSDVTTTDTPAEAAPADKKPSPAQEERAVYDNAFQTLLQDPKEAVPEFRGFLKDYPKSPLASSAQYWVGEALYAEKDFKGAIEEFLVVLKEHKGSDKAPDAALKLGYSFYELKEWDKARKTLEDVISFFPGNAETTKLANERLDKMKTEGH